MQIFLGLGLDYLPILSDQIPKDTVNAGGAVPSEYSIPPFHQIASRAGELFAIPLTSQFLRFVLALVLLSSRSNFSASKRTY